MASGSFTGSTSNQYIKPKITWSSTPNTAGNYSTVTATLTYSRTNTGYTTGGTWNGSLTINGNKKTASKRFNITYNSNTVAITHTVQVSHNANGSKSITISATGTMPDTTLSSTTISSTVTLDTIPRATTPTLSASSVNMGSSVTINTPRASSSFTHDLAYSFAGGSYVSIATGVGTSYAWTVPDLASKIPNATSGTLTVRCITKSGGTSIGTKTVSMTAKVPSSVVPTISTVTLAEATEGLAAQFGAFIQGKSKIKTTITAAGAKGSTIKSYSTTFDGKTYTGSSWTSSAVNKSGSLSMTTIVTDSRGRTEKKTTTLSVLAYSAPAITRFVGFRINSEGQVTNDGEDVMATYSYSVPSLNGGNTASAVIERKLANAEEWETVFSSTALSADAGQLLTGFSADNQWHLRLSVTDYFGEVTIYTITIPTAAVILDILADGTGIGIGKVAEDSAVLDVAWTLRMLGGFGVIVLEQGTDLNTLRQPNTYAGKNANSGEYANCPVNTATFTLQVFPAGESGQVLQRFTTCHKTQPVVYERFYYQSAWGEWVRVSDYTGQLLASPGMFMTSGHTATLAEPVSAQRNGLVLVFSEYVDGAAADQSFHTVFIPKMVVAQHPGKAQCFQMSTSNLAFFATKYLYISDDKIVGHDNNNKTGTGACGITYTNNRFVLRYVIGV